MQEQANRRRQPVPNYSPGQKIWLNAKNLNLKVESVLLVPARSCLSLTLVPFVLSCPPLTVSIPPFMYPRSSPLSPPCHPSPLPRVIGGDPVFTVRHLLDVQRGCSVQYLVNWERYCPEERSWVPHRYVLDSSLIADFHNLHPDKAGCLIRIRFLYRVLASTQHQITDSCYQSPSLALLLQLLHPCSHTPGTLGPFPMDYPHPGYPA
ncbi:uncharacterized protein LOC119896067 [Micropterus salmoides]|uniref:uncharacterized protein LOC119896067 n=1 Tax=Micropterus salmoides TaxID=27706 RepID=UPI0018EAAABE|nr:uncharacterized protein LOC119896067 [Micropterus salmoides]